MTDTRKQRLETFLALHNANEPSNIALNTPLRLEIAAALAYPDGSMTASGLRREAKRGRLVIERTAGKDYTTLHNIEQMRELCRVESRARVSGCAEPNTIAQGGSRTPPSGSLKTVTTGKARDAALMIVEGLRQHSPLTSPTSTSPKRKPGSVHQLTSRSPTS
jgi:hypothetical protein